MPVGVFDSGLGGLTVLEALKKNIPDQEFTYLGDNKNTPYGTKDAKQIFALTCNGVERLWDEGCDLVIIACNTASAVALKRMQETWLPKHKRVLGVFVPMIEAMTERNWGDMSAPNKVNIQQVALFATPATVSSRAFQRELAFRAVGVDVEAQPCAGVVDALEDNDFELADAMVRSHVSALKRRMPNPEVAVLGCTHYPIMKDAFQDALGPSVRVYSQGNIVAASLLDYLKRHPDMVGDDSKGLYLTTGDPKEVSISATRFLRKALQFEAA